MTQLVLASALFLGIHIIISGTPLRARLVLLLGDRPYQGVFSLLSLGALVWMSLAYIDAPHLELWPDQAGLRHGALLLTLLAVVLVVLGLLTPNPTAVGGEKLLTSSQPARGIIKVTRHPFLWGVALWAMAHILANGHLAALIMFGSLLALALVGPRLIDLKHRARDPEGWARLASATSWLPFQALLQGRSRVTLGEIGLWRLAIAVAVYLAILLFLHELPFGLSPMGM